MGQGGKRGAGWGTGGGTPALARGSRCSFTCALAHPRQPSSPTLRVPSALRLHVTLHGFPPPRERELDLPEGARADDAPRSLGIRPELVLVFRDDRPLPGDEPLRDGDRVRILRVVSGG